MSHIFKIAKPNGEVVCPPDRVFIPGDFTFLFTIGGNLVNDGEEYQKLMKLLTELGETEFYLHENMGATVTDRTIPFRATIPVNSDFAYFNAVVNTFDPPFGFTANHFLFLEKARVGEFISAKCRP